MNVVCPEGGSIFRVDPAKIPLAGVRARCSVCGGVIAIGERGRIDDDFASPQAAQSAAARPSAAAASPWPLPPRPAITMPTPPQQSRAQVDA
ncbi:MAG: zinc-ribbon domain-containing protein, partial [Gemmatimonadaceae bacterium]